MVTKVFETRVDVPPEEVWRFHESAEALVALTPPSRRIKLLSSSLLVQEGALHEMKVWMFGILPITWRARISDVTPPGGFTDTAEKSPFAYWRHRHDFIKDGDGTLIRDSISYNLPMGKLGQAVAGAGVAADLDRLFEFRHRATREALSRKPGHSDPA